MVVANVWVERGKRGRKESGSRGESEEVSVVIQQFISAWQGRCDC
jgi:hypothetical protein